MARNARLSGRIVVGALTFGLAGFALAQAPPAAPASPVFEATQARLRDAQTLASLSSEGAVLYQRDRIRLGGYQYCSQAVALAERGEFRQSIRAASKALHLGQQAGNDDLTAHS